MTAHGSSRQKSRCKISQGASGEALSHEAVMKIALPMLGLLVLGTGIWAYKYFLK